MEAAQRVFSDTYIRYVAAAANLSNTLHDEVQYARQQHVAPGAEVEEVFPGYAAAGVSSRAMGANRASSRAVASDRAPAPAHRHL